MSTMCLKFMQGGRRITAIGNDVQDAEDEQVSRGRRNKAGRGKKYRQNMLIANVLDRNVNECYLEPWLAIVVLSDGGEHSRLEAVDDGGRHNTSVVKLLTEAANPELLDSHGLSSSQNSHCQAPQRLPFCPILLQRA